MKEEMVDILDGDGNKINQTLTKSEAHKKGLWHGAAHLWIYNSKDQILLQLRHPKKDIRPNVWDISVAGHISAGMEPRETIVREAKEELGLKVETKNLIFSGVTKLEDPMPEGWIHRCYSWTYLLKKDLYLKSLTLEDGETSEVRWIYVDDFDKELDDPERGKLYSQPAKHVYKFAVNEIRKAISKTRGNL